MTPSTPSTLLGQVFAAYAAATPTDGSGAFISCVDLEERVACGLHLHRLFQELVTRTGERWEKAGVTYDLEVARYQGQLLQLWAAPARRILEQIKSAEADGCQVAGASAFADAELDARICLSMSPERVAAREERIAREGLGGGPTTEDLRRELSHRMGA